MRLELLQVQNFRSIRDQWDEDAIEFRGLDCLVGKNNAGKTNIISAIKYLLEEEDKDLDDELYWNKDDSRSVEVRGYFRVNGGDLDRVQDEERREQIGGLLLYEDDFGGHLGISRITKSADEGRDTSLRLIQMMPVDDRLNEDTFRDYWEKQWSRTKEEDGFTAPDYRDAMKAKYPEIAEFVEEGKATQKGVWEDAYDEFIDSRPDHLELEPQPTEFPSGTKQLIREDVLPDVVKIPALKDVEDTTRASGELGELTDAMYGELEDEVNEKLDKQLDSVYERLDTESISLESRISEYLKESFTDFAVKLDFPRVESRQFFQGVDIRIDDLELDETLSTENVGQGVRRVLIFSMLRTIADLREGSLTISEDDENGNGPSRPLLILYEEAELFLHPNLQKNMLRVFRNLSGSQSQIIFNTHSPLLIQNDILDTINIVRNRAGTEVTQFHTVLDKHDPREQSRLMDLQKVSSYIFSDRVVLVEGVSDSIVLREIASTLNESWRFESQNIPVLDLGGKDDIPLFKKFLNDLDIEVYVMADIGSLGNAIPEIVQDDTLVRRINELKALAGGIGNGGWRGGIELDDDSIKEDRLEIRSDLLAADILVLQGDIEDYYPDVGESNKKEAALKFSADDYSAEELRSHFVTMPGEDETDVEIFLRKVFENA